MPTPQAGPGFNRIRRALFALIERFSPDETTVMVMVAVLVGLMGGMGAVVFRYLVNVFQSLALGSGENTVALLAAVPWWQKILLPIVGGLVVGPMIHFFAREAKGHGVPEVMDAMIFHKGVIRPAVAAVKIVASAITIAFGGSVGREGPIVQIGAGLGSTLGQLLHYSPQRLRTLIGCGAAAGIAATFNAPIAGAFFALEILTRDFAVVTFSPIIVASVVATAVSRTFLGDTPSFSVPDFTIAGWHELPLYLLLGLIVGVVAMVYVRTLYGTEEFFDNLKMPDWLKPTLGGVILGGLFLFFPQVYGVGYSSMVEALDGEMAMRAMALLVVVKLVAVNVTLGSGYSGGIFAPGLFLGGMLGGAFGALVESLVPGSHGAIGTFAMVGMCAMVGSVTGAPLTAILILFEMTGQYTVILPLMLASIGAALVYRAIMSDTIFTLKFTLRGQTLGGGRESAILRDFHVEDIMEVNPVTIPQNKGLDHVLGLFLTHNQEHYYVSDDKGQLVGRISIHDVKDLLHEDNLDQVVIAADICTPVPDAVYRQDNLEHCLLKLGHRDTTDLPVLYNANHPEMVGLISRRAIMEIYNREVLQHRDMGINLVTGEARMHDCVELPEAYKVQIFTPPESWTGLNLKELALRPKYNIAVLAIQHHDRLGGWHNEMPDPDHPLGEDDRLIIVGEVGKLEELLQATSMRSWPPTKEN